MDGALERGGGGGGRGGGEASPEQQVTEPSDAHVEKAAPEKGEDGKYGCQRQVGPCRRGGRCSRDGCRSWSWCVQVGVSSTRFQSKTCHSHCECWECLLCCEFLKSLVCRPRLAAKATAPLFSRGESRELGSDHNGNWSRSVLMPGYIRLSPPIGRSFLRSPRLQTADMRLKQYTSAQDLHQIHQQICMWSLRTLWQKPSSTPSLPPVSTTAVVSCSGSPTGIQHVQNSTARVFTLTRLDQLHWLPIKTHIHNQILCKS
ncbi:uncharacterized protein LOC115569181 isoform X2 [Sparus aurata]|uniref:uncharacterized protein LOC115569181 isoform X2 n=1 Tax=Sparus aurata TaxID=8175 RepID=UPI0011C16267|nr:uncharacterized protein LOC115569181 isoform X2 [Sparus aurata]